MDISEASEFVAKKSGVDPEVVAKVLKAFLSLEGGYVSSRIRKGLPFSLGGLGRVAPIKVERRTNEGDSITRVSRLGLEFVETAVSNRLLSSGGSIAVVRASCGPEPRPGGSGNSPARRRQPPAKSAGIKNNPPITKKPASTQGISGASQQALGPGWVRCKICGTPVKHLDKHVRKMHPRFAGASVSGSKKGKGSENKGRMTTGTYTVTKGSPPRQTRTMCECGCPAIPGGYRCYACSSD